MRPDAYCRDVEHYLCRQNEGHLIRIVGPAFDMVRRWVSQGVPLTVVFRGIDRYIERYYAKGPRRRPVRVEFCESDVLDVFDQWRRAVGLSMSDLSSSGSLVTPEPARRSQGLESHLARVLASFDHRAAEPGLSADVAEFFERTRAELETMRASAKGLRGAKRQEQLDRLQQLDDELVAAGRRGLADGELADLTRTAEAELEPFLARMDPDAFGRAVRAATDRLIRQHARLPELLFA